MNQILDEKMNVNKKIKILFKFQFYISFIFIIVLFLYWLNIIKIKNKEKKLSEIVNSNAKLYLIFNEANENIYFGRIVIEKIELDYFVYKECTEELLKILPCKYNGPNLGQSGNICILGHNYLDGNFFSNLNKLDNNDSITLVDLDGKKYVYKIYEKVVIYENQVNEYINFNTNDRILTLCTCTSDKNKRLIIQARGY